MKDYQQQFEELFEQSYGTASVEKVAVLEQAIRLADAHNDVELGIEGRMQLLEVASFAGTTDRSLPAMAWLLAKYDEDPESMNQYWGVYSLMWSYKWIGANLPSYPSISLEKIESLIDDLATRYDQLGYDRRAVESVRIDAYLMLGDAERLREAYNSWSTLPCGEMSDCEACEQNAAVRCNLVWGDFDKAYELAQPLFDGKMTCAEMPYTTYGHMLMPMFDAGLIEEADKVQRKAQRKIRSVPGERGLVGNQLAFLALTDQANRAVRLLDNNLTPALAITESHHRCYFFTGTAVLAKTLHNAGRTAIKLKDHPGLGVERDDKGTVQTQALGDWCEAQARDIANQYDQRAGTRYWTDELEKALARVETQKQVPKTEKA